MFSSCDLHSDKYSRRLTALAVACVVAALPACGGGPEVLSEPPNDLLGRWETDVEGYENAYLEFTPTRVKIGTVENTELRYSLSKVTALRDEMRNSTEYKVLYLEDAQEYAMNVSTANDRPDEIWLTSQPQVVFSRVGDG